MQHAAQAYGKVANETASPRELEASLLLKAAARLQAVRDAWDPNSGQLGDALLYNRKLWSIFLTSVTRADHPLPDPVRQNVANLGLFVMNQTLSLTAEPQPEKLGALININRELAAGLLGRGLAGFARSTLLQSA
jgi:flagellar protein FlaF